MAFVRELYRKIHSGSDRGFTAWLSHDSTSESVPVYRDAMLQLYLGLCEVAPVRVLLTIFIS